MAWPSPQRHIKVWWQEIYISGFSLVQSLSRVWLFVTPWTAAHQASLPLTISWSLLKLMSIEWVMPSNRLIFCHLLILLPSIFRSIRVFSNELALRIRYWSIHQVYSLPKYWSFSISSFKEYSVLISFRIDWFDLLAVQGTLKSLLQPHSSKVLILWCSAYGSILASIRDYLKSHSFD